MDLKAYDDLREFFFISSDRNGSNSIVNESTSAILPERCSLEMPAAAEPSSKWEQCKGEDNSFHIDAICDSHASPSADQSSHWEKYADEKDNLQGKSDLETNLVEELVVTHSEYHTVQYGVDIVSEDLYGILSSSQYEETPNDDSKWCARSEERHVLNEKLFCRSRTPRCRSVENDHPYSCPFCSKVFFFFLMMLKLRGMRFVGQILLSLSYLHVLTEILNIMTFESFNKKWRLSCHMEQVHTKIRNFSCSQCDKKFRSDYDLKRHSTTHTGQRFVCYHCDTGFASKQRVACHIRRSIACWDRKS
ncbi:hypothetical protein PRIPAC_78780 [Pristionchus pacificus]|uniref:C2H2-type domain-containing protein n=1 Tax=Pristionchus pacificus TaxID=54126 RepID=A0A2A6BYJ3_PRIPA|nr:hypothetical protein PRIPAC_78780 [Pristionchus pacificus]|eukprot:PDM70897.1 hypothetical protein PRIPAC_44293 [Pristionchus pacificus]